MWPTSRATSGRTWARNWRRWTRKLDGAFSPDHYHYAFLQNADRHVHLHVIPRYAGPRKFAGERFVDPDWPGHYAVPMPDRRRPARVIEALTAKLR